MIAQGSTSRKMSSPSSNWSWSASAVAVGLESLDLVADSAAIGGALTAAGLKRITATVMMIGSRIRAAAPRRRRRGREHCNGDHTEADAAGGRRRWNLRNQPAGAT